MFRESTIILLSLFFSLAVGVAAAADYNYIKTDDFKSWLEKGKEVIIVDIQVPDEFAKRHFPEAIETNAYPVKNDEDRARLEKTLERIAATSTEVVIVCPRGEGGAKRTYDFLHSQGVAESRLLILEKGMEGWPYPSLCTTGR